MLQAVIDHESVHETRLAPALAAVAPALQKEFAKLKIAQSDSVDSAEAAVRAVKASPQYAATCAKAREIWDAKYVKLIWDDHKKLTPTAEHAVVDPKIRELNKQRKDHNKSQWFPKGWK